MRRAAAALFLLAAGACRKPAGESPCPHDPGFDRSRVIRVRAEVPPAVLRRDLDLAALAKESAGSVAAGKAQGLTEVGHRLALRTLVNAETARGRTCAWFDEVNVDLAPSSVQIFVPREYPEGSCESAAVLEHEREHERVHRERLAAAAAEIEAALAGARWLPARGNPLESGDRASAEAALDAKLRKVVSPVYEKFREELRVEQAALDEPALYQWVSKRCSGWK